MFVRVVHYELIVSSTYKKSRGDGEITPLDYVRSDGAMNPLDKNLLIVPFFHRSIFICYATIKRIIYLIPFKSHAGA